MPQEEWIPFLHSHAKRPADQGNVSLLRAGSGVTTQYQEAS